MNGATVREFFDAWSIYDQVLDHNYMFHEELYLDVQRLIANRYADRPFTLLDLGCGSARHLAHALEGRPICRYLGYDLSEIALAHASRNLSKLICPIELHQGDLLDGLKANQESFDLIFSSFALHHLSSAGKATFFQLAYERLKEDGILLLIDVMREDDEDDLQLHLDQYCGWLRSEWKALPSEAQDTLCDHIRNNDFPERASELYAMATHASFSRYVEINRFGWYRTGCFEKSCPFPESSAMTKRREPAPGVKQ